MPRPKPNYNPPADLLDRLPKTSKPTRNDMLNLLGSIPNYVGSLLNAGTNRKTFNAIVETIRTQKDSAPARTGAPSNPNQSTEGAPSIASSPLERKIITAHGCTLLVTPRAGVVALDLDAEPLDLTADEARQLAALLEEAAGDVDRDGAVREHYANLVKQ
jgi:hypothetical protein